MKALRYKVDLPNYGVFDEKRVFTPGPMPGPIDIRGVRIGVPICEDIWKGDVVECIAETGGEFLLVPNGSPFEATKEETRLNIAVARVVESGLPLAYLNQVGGQDELVFDGASFVLNPDRSLAAADARLGRSARDHELAPRRQALDLRTGPEGGTSRRARGDLSGDGAGPARLRAQEPLPRRGAGPFRRHRLRADGGGRRRRAGRRERALRDDAVALHRQDSLDDAAEVARLLGTQLDNDPDRGRRESLRRDAGAALRRHARPTRPRRTSSRASAA